MKKTFKSILKVQKSTRFTSNKTMATGGVADGLGKIKRHLECSICFNRFTEPKVLDCLHSFCLNCLKHLRESKGMTAVRIKCPLCRCYTELEKNQVEHLPTNFTLSALVEEFAIHEQLLKGQGSEIKCQSCSKKNQATSFCQDCVQFLCNDCQDVHEHLAGTKSHNTYTMVQLQSGEIAYKSKLREEPKCNKHPDQNINIYCNTCEQLICTTCSVLKHKQHSCADISEAFDKCKQEIEGLMAKANKMQNELEKAMKNTAESRKTLDTMFEATNKKISQKADKEVARIREMEQKLKQEAQEIYQDRVKTFKAAEDANNSQLKVAELELAEMNQLLAQEIKTEILHLKQQFLFVLRELTKQQPQIVPQKLHFIDFQDCFETEKTFGRLILEGEWRLDKKMELDEKHTVTSVAVFSNDEIVTVDTELSLFRHTCKQLVTYRYLPTSNPQSPFISQVLQIPEVEDPHQVAVNRLDHIIVLDGLAVKTFSREYQLLHQFQPGIDSDSQPTCLAVDDDNLIAVGYKAKGEISLHNPDGTLIRRLQEPMIDDQMVASNNRLMYTNSILSLLVSLDYYGKIVFNVNTDPSIYQYMLSPRSVCCDNQGNIYIYMCHDNETSPLLTNLFSLGIHQCNSEGKHIRCIIKEDMDVSAMTFTSSGDLVLGGEGLLKVYCRV